MNTMHEIADRLGHIEEKTKGVLADLEKLGSIQRSLEESNNALTAVNAHVTEIAQTARTSVGGSKPAINGHPKTGHFRRPRRALIFTSRHPLLARWSGPYGMASGPRRRSVTAWSAVAGCLVRQLRGPHFSTCA